MNRGSIELIRNRLKFAFKEDPSLEGITAVCVLWRFPHLESLNQSWTLLDPGASPVGLLRIASSERSDDRPGIEVNDIQLDIGDWIAIFEVLESLEIVGSQIGGIYDGPEFGLDWFDGMHGVRKMVKWINEDTMDLLRKRLPMAVSSIFGGGE